MERTDVLTSKQDRKISTTVLSKELGISTKEMFSRLMKVGYITRQNDDWVLTDLGKDKGGVLLSSKHGQYIAWPKNIDISTSQKPQENKSEFATATKIGEVYDLPAKRINFILSEIGWINKHMKGWILTEQGKRQGGRQMESYQSGVPYVGWPVDIIESNVLKETIHNIKGTTEVADSVQKTNQAENSFRDKFKATHRSTDGHMVRSKAEMLIDNWLYMAEIVHAYERKLPIEEELYSDFYIPTGKVYIEYWGLWKRTVNTFPERKRKRLSTRSTGSI